MMDINLTGIVKISEIVNDLTTGGVAVPLSAEQGKELKVLIDAITNNAYDDVVFFDTADPNTGGTIFDPATPELTGYLYVSSSDASTWIWNGSAYITETVTVPDSTPFYLYNTTVDAGGNKTSGIQRSGNVRLLGSVNGTMSTVVNTHLSGHGLYASIPSAGTGYSFRAAKGVINQLRVNNDGSLLINDVYTLPSTAGTPDQVLKFPSSGNVLEWGVIGGGGLVNFSEANTTATPNATIPVDSLTAIDAGSNADVAIIPKGTGALLAQVPDNTTAGGDKRGIYAVDWQRDRITLSSAVASGNHSVISGGQNSTASGDWATVTGGKNNNSSGDYSTTSGFQCVGSHNYAVAMGRVCTATNQGAVGLGYESTATNLYAFAVGYQSLASGQASMSLGYDNHVSGHYAGAIGVLNRVSGTNSFVTGRSASDFGILGRVVHSSRNIAVDGDSQSSLMTLSASTTDATLKILTVVGVPTALNQLMLQNNNSIRFKGSIVGRESGSTNTSCWDIDGFIQRGTTAGSTVLLVGNVTVISNLPAWGTPTLTADTSFGGLNVNVEGLAGTNIRWTASLKTTEVIYA